MIRAFVRRSIRSILLRLRLSGAVRGAVPADMRIVLDWHSDPSLVRYVGFTLEGRTLRLSLSRLPRAAPFLGDRLPALATVLAGCRSSVRGMAEISDGEAAGRDIISFCGRHDSVLIPDHDFVRSRGYSGLRAASAHAPPFSERPDLLLWRGATSGHGRICAPAMTPETRDLNARTRLCLMLKGIEGCDAKLSKVVQTAAPELVRQQLLAAGIFGGWIPPRRWLNVRYHVAIDGNTLAWSSTFTRLLMGCCVLKPESNSGYRQWYTHRLVPWEHYVPVAADLGDLVERIAWCRANPDQAAAIAERGRALAVAIEYEPEVASAAARIDDAFADGPRAADPALVSAVFGRRRVRS